MEDAAGLAAREFAGADNATSREIIGQFPATYRQFVLASSISSSPRPLRIARIM